MINPTHIIDTLYRLQRERTAAGAEQVSDMRLRRNLYNLARTRGFPSAVVRDGRAPGGFVLVEPGRDVWRRCCGEWRVATVVNALYVLKVRQEIREG